ncbi:hypothetical protein ACFX10_036083 [Malus domestica]
MRNLSLQKLSHLEPFDLSVSHFYIQCARTQRIPSITFPDCKLLIDYLTRKISSSDSIEFILLPQNDAIHHSKSLPPSIPPATVTTSATTTTITRLWILGFSLKLRHRWTTCL